MPFGAGRLEVLGGTGEVRPCGRHRGRPAVSSFAVGSAVMQACVGDDPLVPVWSSPRVISRRRLIAAARWWSRGRFWLHRGSGLCGCRGPARRCDVRPSAGVDDIRSASPGFALQLGRHVCSRHGDGSSGSCRWRWWCSVHATGNPDMPPECCVPGPADESLRRGRSRCGWCGRRRSHRQ